MKRAARGCHFLCALCLSATLAGEARSAPILTNGGFEDPGIPLPSDYTYLDSQPNLIPGWTVAYDGIVEPSYYLRDGHSPDGGTVVHAAEGQYLLALSDGDSVMTTFSSVVGQQYVLTYYGAQPDTLRITVGDVDRLELSGDGVLTSIPFDNHGYFYSRHDIAFTATSPLTTLTLYNVQNNTQFGNFALDGFAVMSVPEPACITMMWVCGLALLLRRRRQRCQDESSAASAGHQGH